MGGSRRQRLARGIYQDRYGIAAVVTVGGWRKERRYPLGTPLDVIAQHMEALRARYRRCGQSRTVRGSFAADVDRYLGTVRHLASWVSLRAELRAWVRALPPDILRYQIDTATVLRIRNDWLAAGVKRKTVNNRVSALSRLWHALDGPKVPTPCDEVRPLSIHKTPPVAIPAAIVQRTYEGLLDMERRGILRDAKTRARFMLMATTGKRPSEIMRAEPTDVDLERRVWVVRDGKGGWSPGVYLNDEMLAAWRLFVKAEAWGKFREGALVKTLQSAGWPKGIRPYNLRHTVGILMSDSGVDLADIQAHLGHKRIETTRKHYVPVIGSRLQRASELLDRRFGWTDDEAS